METLPLRNSDNKFSFLETIWFCLFANKHSAQLATRNCIVSVLRLISFSNVKSTSFSTNGIFLYVSDTYYLYRVIPETNFLFLRLFKAVFFPDFNSLRYVKRYSFVK